MIKLSAVIAEYNPFHNGHLYNLNKIKEQSGCDSVAVVMSGNFTQRGEVAILDKYTRAKHAILAGADIVVELPTVYATANAEIFAHGGVKIFNSLNASTLCFGAENAVKEEFLQASKVALKESKEFKKVLKTHLKEGYKFAKAKSLALKEVYSLSEELTGKPNNILGIEYVKALLKQCPFKDFLPIKRIGSDYNDNALSENFSSASAIRKAILNNQNYSSNLPDFVSQDILNTPLNHDSVLIYSLLTKSVKELKNIPDCTEGLENRIYRLVRECNSAEELIGKLLCKRYTKTRIQRILLNCLLGVDKKNLSLAKKTTPYLKVLAIKKDKLDLLGQIGSHAPLITRKGDEEKLNKKQKILFEKDIFAGEIYSLIGNKKQNPYEMKII